MTRGSWHGYRQGTGQATRDPWRQLEVFLFCRFTVPVNLRGMTSYVTRCKVGLFRGDIVNRIASNRESGRSLRIQIPRSTRLAFLAAAGTWARPGPGPCQAAASCGSFGSVMRLTGREVGQDDPGRSPHAPHTSFASCLAKYQSRFLSLFPVGVGGMGKGTGDWSRGVGIDEFV